MQGHNAVQLAFNLAEMMDFDFTWCPMGFGCPSCMFPFTCFVEGFPTYHIETHPSNDTLINVGSCKLTGTQVPSSPVADQP